MSVLLRVAGLAVIGLMLVPGVAAGSSERPDVVDEAGDAGPAGVAGDILGGWFDNVTSATFDVTVELASVMPHEALALDVRFYHVPRGAVRGSHEEGLRVHWGPDQSPRWDYVHSCGPDQTCVYDVKSLQGRIVAGAPGRVVFEVDRVRQYLTAQPGTRFEAIRLLTFEDDRFSAPVDEAGPGQFEVPTPPLRNVPSFDRPDVPNRPLDIVQMSGRTHPHAMSNIAGAWFEPGNEWFSTTVQLDSLNLTTAFRCGWRLDAQFSSFVGFESQSLSLIAEFDSDAQGNVSVETGGFSSAVGRVDPVIAVGDGSPGFVSLRVPGQAWDGTRQADRLTATIGSTCTAYTGRSGYLVQDNEIPSLGVAGPLGALLAAAAALARKRKAYRDAAAE